MIRIDLICGYLGSGKTTYLNRLLSATEDLSGLAVMVNDFGEVNLDAALISAANPGVDPVPFANGCVCCSVTDDFTLQLERLAALGNIDRICLEASGVAIPTRLKHQCSYPGFEPGTVLTLVDASSYESKRLDKYVGHLVEQQVAQADLVQVTKIDLNPTFQIPDIPRPAFFNEEQDFESLLWQPNAHFSLDRLRATRHLWERVKGIIRYQGQRRLVQGSASGVDSEPTTLEETGLTFITHRSQMDALSDALDRL